MNIKKICLFAVGMLCLGSYAVKAEELDGLSLTSKNAIVIDANTGEVICEYNSEEKKQIASTTKLMTALLLAENYNKDSVLAVTENALKQPSTSINKDIVAMTNNDKVLGKDVMDGLMLRSGNDMAVMIAENISGDEVAFSKVMDNKAKELAMYNTDFYTASGLDTDNRLNGENHYSTAYDMSLLGKAAYENEWIRESMGLKTSTFSINGGVSYNIENSNKNLGLNGCVGGKTGYTTKAGRCLVAMYERDNRVLIGVVLGGSNPGYFEDMNKIMDYAYSKNRTVLHNKDNEIYKLDAEYKTYKFFGKDVSVSVPLYIDENIEMYDNTLNQENTTYELVLNDFSVWGLKKGESIGKLVAKNKGYVEEYNLLSSMGTKDILRVNISYYVKMTIIAVAVVAVGVMLRRLKIKRLKVR